MRGSLPWSASHLPPPPLGGPLPVLHVVRRGGPRGGQECQVRSHAAGRAARRLSPRARARAARPAPWPRPAPACPARIGAAGCRSPRSGEGAPPAALLQQRAARCWCDPGFPGCLGVRRRQRTSPTPRRRQQGRRNPGAVGWSLNKTIIYPVKGFHEEINERNYK
ncbi:A-kinase anchor protein 5 isoform X2 [Mustela erminea]|uniref:A-kinase anchor protein 5 isoform X2 n=1 Tax=Mustela erminea TaxID=36723 RepID=UPI00138721DE|nr:A-kinase anchor protein 5 isoform X2 [Mustela erminea]